MKRLLVWWKDHHHLPPYTGPNQSLNHHHTSHTQARCDSHHKSSFQNISHLNNRNKHKSVDGLNGLYFTFDTIFLRKIGHLMYVSISQIKKKTGYKITPPPGHGIVSRQKEHVSSDFQKFSKALQKHFKEIFILFYLIYTWSQSKLITIYLHLPVSWKANCFFLTHIHIIYFFPWPNVIVGEMLS